MTIKLKTWVGLGLGTLALGTGLSACGEGGEGGEASEQGSYASASGEMGEGEGGEAGEGEGGEAGHSVDALPLPSRLAFMAGHVEAGLALYRAGEAEMAAKHLLHPVSETHAGEREGLDALGFDASLFEEVSKALDEGRAASEIEPQLAAAQANLAMLAKKAGGDPAEIIRFLMDTIVEEYQIAITDGAVTDPGEYQDAWGFAVVARDRAELFDEKPEGIDAALDSLIALWPEDAPLPPADPAPIGQVMAQTSQVVLVLPAAE
ncbi:hypothetical protein HK107_11945 [Parvularcula sp. ZS-1/3]|uniref:Lipoprotein n=1 Tax=Parvularcula mediterranea TaxID=2732508 RepID=A0A7Y3W5Z9_9PROT|nr:hypothetical protein [Parvularcula mediterranea]NNU17033.1 hypothetical protein [Parvularcula mediterranea]